MVLPKAVSAATEQNPYPYYASLIEEGGIARDEESNLWVVSSAQWVRDVLLSPNFVTRPGTEPVPSALLGTEAGSVFGALVRMTDGAAQRQTKAHLVKAIALLSENDIYYLTRDVTSHYLNTTDFESTGADVGESDVPAITQLSFTVPVMVMAKSLGVSNDQLEEVARLTGKFVACISPLSSPDELDAASIAAKALRDEMQERIGGQHNPFTGALVKNNAQGRAIAANVLLANMVGLLSQTYDATAGMINQTLVTMERHRLSKNVLADAKENAFKELIHEVVRYDSPIQNTRRFATVQTTISHSTIQPGDAVLLLLAAANRDPAANPNPNTLDPARVNPDLFTFSLGAHQCPGRDLAVAICGGVVSSLLESGFSRIGKPVVSGGVNYIRSLNARIPLI